MSSIPGRSESQRSYTKGKEQISVRRISLEDEQQDDEGQRSGVGSFRSSWSSSSSPSGDSSAHDSCVLKHFSKHRSSHLRFLAWVAYTRRFSNNAITDEERRTCPLLWCRTEFADQDAMLQHVWNCPHLSKGLYWCFHCQKHERLGKFHKRCTGTPSKTDRLANVAKRIFSKLGSGSHRKASQSSSEGTFVLNNSWKSTDVKDPTLFRESPMWDASFDIQEMPDTSICPEMAADWSAMCQELADTSVRGMAGEEVNNGISDDCDLFGQQDNYYSESFDDCEVTPPAPKPRAATPKLPRLDTSMSPLYRGEWKYPIQNPQRRISSIRGPSIDHIVSPLSAVGPADVDSTFEISPTETEASGASFFTDSGYTSATSAGDTSQCPSRVPSTKRAWDCVPIPEEHYLLDHATTVAFSASFPGFEQVLSESLFSTPSVSRSSSNASDKSKAKDLSPHWSDARTLVQSLSEVLDEQMAHTKSTLREMPSNPVTNELLAMSKPSVVSIGLEVLAGILEGRQPTSIIQVFSFTQIACASAITSDADSDVIHGRQWFDDAMVWTTGISSQRNRQLYTEVATAVWQPRTAIPSASQPDTPSTLCPPNLLLQNCKQFLDILEHYDTVDKEAQSYQTPCSGFDFPQLTFELNGTNRVIDRLKSIKTIEGFLGDIIMVGDKLKSGRIRNTRRLELELISAAKASSQSHVVYDRFLNHVTALCDNLYAEETDSSTSRTAHQIRDIALLKQYLPEDTYDNGVHGVSEEFNMSFDECFDFAGASVEGQTDFNLNILESSTSFQQQSSVMDSDLGQPLSSYPALAPQQQYNPPTTPHVPMFQFTAPTPPTSSLALTPMLTPCSSVRAPQSTTTTSPQDSSPSTTPSTTPQDRYRCFCGYVPSGEEKWKASNLRRHKRTQHADADGGSAKTYRCKWMGCRSVFTRSDNLRSHQRSRGHGDYAGLMIGGASGSEQIGGSQRKKQKRDDLEPGGFAS